MAAILARESTPVSCQHDTRVLMAQKFHIILFDVTETQEFNLTILQDSFVRTGPSQWRMFDIIVLLYNAERLGHEWADFAPESIVHVEMDEWLACYRRKGQVLFTRIQQRSLQQGRKYFLRKLLDIFVVE